MLKGETVSVSPLKSPWAPPVRNRHRQTHYGSTVLLCRGLHNRKDGNEYAAFGFGFERDATVDQREKGVILAHADILTGMPSGAALTRENVAGNGGLAAEHLHAKALARGVAAVPGRSACFLVSHSAVLNSFSLYRDSAAESSHKY